MVIYQTNLIFEVNFAFQMHFSNNGKEHNKLKVPNVQMSLKFVIQTFKSTFSWCKSLYKNYIAYVCFLHCSNMSDRKDYNERSL